MERFRAAMAGSRTGAPTTNKKAVIAKIVRR
jgi:hypothetical protein